MFSISPARILILTLLTSLSGCAASPAPAPAPAAVQSPAAPWWQALHDPRLDALQAQALQTNVDALRKALSWQSAQAQARLTGLDEQPSPSLGLNASTSRALHAGTTSVLVNGVNVPVDTGARTTRSYGASAGLSYEVDLWSRLAQATRADRADAALRREEWYGARWLLGTRVAEAYWTIAAIDARLPLLTELAQAADEAVRIAQVRLKEGKLRADEVDVVVTRQYEARRRVADAQIDRRLRLNALAVLLDRDTAALEPQLAPGMVRLPAGEPPPPTLGTPAQTLERRPDVRQARLAVDAALARLHVAEAARYPALNLGLNLLTNGGDWGHWFSQPLATLGAGLAVPLVDWRRLDTRRDIARNTLDDAALALRATVRQALTDVDNALLERERWRQAWQAAQAQRAEKEKVHAVARLRQEAGAAGRLDVLQSREGVLAAEIELIDLRLRAWIDLMTLYKATGEGAESSL